MEERSLEDTDPDLKSEDPDVAEPETEAVGVQGGDGLTEPHAEACEVEEEEAEETGNEDEVYTQNAWGKPEEEFGAQVTDDLLAGDDIKEGDLATDVEIFQSNDKEEEPESHVEDDHTEHTADPQNSVREDPEDESELLRELQTEWEQLTRLNHQLQTKLKPDGEPGSALEKIPGADSAGEKYADIKEMMLKDLQHRRVEDLHRRKKENMEQIEHEWSALALDKREELVRNLEQVMGRTKARDVTERLLTEERRCEEEFLYVRQEHFHLNRKIPKLRAGLQVREEEPHGEIHHIDYEQLKMENKSYREKIQEGMKDVLKLRRTLPHIGQIQMHVKEKLRFVQVEKRMKRERSAELEAVVLREQKALTQTMQARDVLRFDSLRRRQDCGLLGNATLLRDFEDTEDERQALERRVKELKRHT